MSGLGTRWNKLIVNTCFIYACVKVIELSTGIVPECPEDDPRACKLRMLIWSELDVNSLRVNCQL